MTFDGILLVDKPAGISSFGVVARVRRILSQAASKKIKVGHTGTLDPFATGLMIVVVGTYCKRASEFSNLGKSYQATITLGSTSSTGDPEGEITPISTTQPTQAEIEKALAAFRGTIEQTPPKYSAIKVGGVRAYKLARAGDSVEIPKRTVTISQLSLVDYDYPEIRIVCSVSSGTYIRTLAEDIGRVLGIGAYCSKLRRTQVGEYTVNNAVMLRDDMTANDLPLKSV